MPQLKSGRHVAISASPYLDALLDGNDASRYFAIVALRLNAGSPAALRDHLVVGYFREGQGTPPDAPSYNSGYCVGDILAGHSDWQPDEVEEFRQFLEEPRVTAWLQGEFAELDRTIRENPVWASDLLATDENGDPFDAAMIQRTIIQRSALEPGAMAQLRGVQDPRDTA